MKSPVVDIAADRCATSVVDLKGDVVKADETPRAAAAVTIEIFMMID